MELYARQQFDFFFNTAIERFVDRIEQRCGGPVPALERVRESPNGDGVWLDEFVATLFRDFMLDNLGGATFVLQALAKRPAIVPATSMSIDQTLQAMARASFASILAVKTEEVLEQRLIFQVTE